jgi:hypothetical protein
MRRKRLQFQHHDTKGSSLLGSLVVRRLGDTMKRGIRITLLASLLLAIACALALFLWDYSQEPTSIPYEAWDVPHDPIFPLSKSEPDVNRNRIRNEDMLRADDFVFTMGVGSGMYGLDIFRVDAEGNATYIFSTGYGDWWRTEFKIPVPALVKLRQLLVDVDYASLERAYLADVCDGTQWCLRVDVAGTTKKVYCNNYFPDAAERLAIAISREVLPAHETELKRARRIWESSAKNAAAVLWR